MLLTEARNDTDEFAASDDTNTTSKSAFLPRVIR